jgi:hypothetical protein
MVSEEKKIDEKSKTGNDDSSNTNIQVILAQRRKEQLEASVKRSIPVVAPEDEVSFGSFFGGLWNFAEDSLENNPCMY